MEKVKTSVSIDKDVYEFIQKLAEDERANFSHIVNKHFYQLMKATLASDSSIEE